MWRPPPLPCATRGAPLAPPTARLSRAWAPARAVWVALLCLSTAASAQDDAPPLPAAEPLVIDRMVLVIGDRIITDSEVRLEAELRQRVAWWGPPRPPGADTQQIVADVALVRILAGDTSLYLPSDEAVRARAEQLREAWGDPEAYQGFLGRHGLDEARLAALIRSRLVVERYIQRNLSLAARAEGRSIDELYIEWIPEQRGRVPVRVPSPVGVP